MPSAQANGNVTVSVSSDGSLIVTGDRRSNCILIRGGGDNDEYTVEGCNSTTVNGVLLGYDNSFFGVINDMKITMLSGSDQVIIDAGDNHYSRRNLEITTGSENDDVRVSRWIVLGDMTISTGDEDDSVSLEDVSVQDDVNINTGNGNDAICMKSGRYQPTDPTYSWTPGCRAGS